MFTYELSGEAGDHMALWVLGDSVLERYDRRAYERWKAGLGVTFVLARLMSSNLPTH